MKVLVTGANGYLGSGVVKKLLDMGVTVIATDMATTHIDSRARIYQCNLFEIANPFEYFEEPEVIVHMAWRDGFIHNSINHILDLHKHYEFLLKMCTGGVRKISVLGSMHEIGFHEGSIDEDTPTDPRTLYGISKDTLRQLTKLMCAEQNTEYQWLRGYYIVGTSDNGASIFSKIIQSEKDGKEKFPFTTGQNQFDFIDYDMFCDLLSKVVLQDDVCGVINICSGKPERLSDRIETFLKENNLNIRLEYGVFPERPNESKAIWGNDKKLNLALESYYRRQNES
ncbi:NAD-dependent epimerase/dehydratase family protein [Streptococcus suis]|uniref:NAD dependent epimerase/dehydratase n=1 Tax=Streptococcus suis TaxID=1307 RepID=A0A1P8VRW0_STRSU|nr:NAD dependent epimerase/dehydratase [Streptococcus suis]MCK4019634.1 NAD-dependent epimerase/dehydratase family protein [Streptococcus suis]HEL2460690.1 NAD-dependent epimerase/dehydratase family protein [Streptococcus suis]HEM6011612.1 NAD-dependent epimerase/dehydratase family protein [Streptococcus suis]HEM6041489.1 NAD-dependent epimerase/dehydratase family protein [Streptococcus suis]